MKRIKEIRAGEGKILHRIKKDKKKVKSIAAEISINKIITKKYGI